MGLAAILAAKAEVPLSIRIGSQHAGWFRLGGPPFSIRCQSLAIFSFFFFIWFFRPLIEIDKCVRVGDF